MAHAQIYAISCMHKLYGCLRELLQRKQSLILSYYRSNFASVKLSILQVIINHKKAFVPITSSLAGFFERDYERMIIHLCAKPENMRIYKKKSNNYVCKRTFFQSHR